MTLRRSLHLAALFGAALTRVACSNEGTSPASAGAGPPGGPSAGAIEDRLHAPAGFKVTYFARDLPGARFMALGPDGSVYVSQMARGQVTRLFDADGDGAAEVVTP